MSRLYDEQLVLRDSLSFIESSQSDHGRQELALVQLRGHIVCAHGVAMKVYKRMDVRCENGRQPEVRTGAWEYHAWVPKLKRDILRYDNAHGPLHKHTYDLLTGQERVGDIRRDDLPTLAEVVREATDLGRVLGIAHGAHDG